MLHHSDSPYLHHLLGALDGVPGSGNVDEASTDAAGAAVQVEELFISPQTVKSHVTNVYAKLGVGNRGQALVIAESLGWTPKI